jgi:uncharacterized membrane-anchored protein
MASDLILHLLTDPVIVIMAGEMVLLSVFYLLSDTGTIFNKLYKITGAIYIVTFIVALLRATN